MTTESILHDADLALADALQSDPKARLDAITRFMHAFDDLAREIFSGHGSWDAVRPWARDAVERVLAARPALGEWETEMGQLFYSASRDESDAEAALDRRSQHAFAREAFRDTPINALLAKFEDAEVDQDFHDEADRLALDAPSYAPASHTWWRHKVA